jgi:hypothetical protein
MLLDELAHFFSAVPVENAENVEFVVKIVQTRYVRVFHSVSPPLHCRRTEF